jgi:hypothetical protein
MHTTSKAKPKRTNWIVKRRSRAESAALHRQIADAYAAGEPVGTIAAAYAVDVRLITYARKKHGIEKRRDA